MRSKMFLPKTHFMKKSKKRGGGEGDGKIRGTYEMYVSDTVGRARESVNIWGNSRSFINFPCYTREVCECLILDQKSTQEKNFPANLW